MLYDRSPSQQRSFALNEVVMPTQPDQPLTLLAEATPLQRRAFELLDVNPNPDPNVFTSGTNAK